MYQRAPHANLLFEYTDRVPTVSAAEIERYHAQGFLLKERVLDAERCDALTREADRLAAGRYHNYLRFHEDSDLFRALITDVALLTMFDTIQHHRMVPIGSIFFFCKPGNDLEQGSRWHQDNYAAKAPSGSYMVAGVALDDADADNGSLVVFPKTHTLGDLPSRPSKNFDMDEHGHVVRAYPIGSDTDVPAGYEPLQLCYSRGSAIFLHAHTLHGAPRNPSPTRWRRMIYLHFIKDGDPFWPGWTAKRTLIDRSPYLGPSS